MLCCFAYFFASNAMLAGSEPYDDLIIGASIAFACVSNCSIDAALNVSPAAKTEVILFFFKRWESLAIDVVFPDPLIPKKIIVNGSLLFLECSFICSNKFGGSIMTERIKSLRL